MTVTMKETRRELLKNLNPHLLCVLCAGYYIDPTTIVECLHSFCRSCIVKYLETSRFCPICDVQLHKTKPLLSIRRDKILERLVYKIVPGLYGKEMSRRNSPREELYLSPDDLVSLVLQYHMEDNGSQAPNEEETHDATNKDKIMAAHRKYLKCPAAVTVEHLKKFLILKYSLTDEHQVDIFHTSECLPDDLSLIDVAYCFEWKQTSPMELHFQILQKSTVAVPIVEEVESIKDVDMDDDSHSVASSSLPFMSSKSLSECDDASNTSLDSKPLIERLESERAHQKRKRNHETSDDEPEEKKSLFDCLFQSTTNNNIENEDKDFQESDEDYSKYEQDIEEIIEEDDDDDTDRLRITTNLSEDELVNHDETPSQMFVIDEAIEEEKYEKVVKEKHWKSEGRTKKKSKKAKHHHHHHKRRISQSPPPTATIVHSPDRDIMKLKVKLNTLPGYRHKDEKYHKHNKHSNGSMSSASSIVSSPSRSSYKEDDSVLSEQSCDSAVAVKNPREDVKFVSDKPVGEPRKSQMPQNSQSASDSSHKSESLLKEPTQHAQRCTVRPKPKQSVEQQSGAEQSHKNNVRIMPPSSITVSIITAEEKLKMEKDKTLMLTGNHDFENKRPSLEIVRVNGPPASPPICVTANSNKTSPKPTEQNEEPPVPRPKTKKPVPAVIPLKSTKPSITITPQNGKNSGSSHTNCGPKLDEMKTSVTISLENGSQNESALDLSGKSSRKDGGQPIHPTAVNNNKTCTSPHANGSVQYEQPSGMRNLMTLSDTAVHIRNMMSSSCKDLHQQKPQQQYQQQQQLQQQDLKKRFGNNHVVNSNGSCSPKRPNGNVPLRIPVPPTSGSFAKTSPAAPSPNKSAKVSLAASRTCDVKPKHGPPNQGVRHIPNPSVLLFRHHQQHLAQFAVAAAASAAAAVNSNNNNNNNIINAKRPSPMHVAASRIPAIPAAIPFHNIRKMENMTKNIEKVAAGLSVKATNALYKQNFIENGRARLELPS